MHEIAQDVRYSVRQLVHRPGFALTAIVSLGLGIGATTAVFSVLYATLINPYPYPGADRIVRMSVRTKKGNVETVNLNDPQVRQLRQAHAVESVIAMDYHAATLTGRELPENVNVIGLIGNGFADLGVPVYLGRPLGAADATEGRDPEPVIVLSYRFWQRRFLSDPEIVGKTVELNRKKQTVVGVAGPRFIWYNADAYAPMKLAQDPDHMCIVDFRLRRGVTREAANAELAPMYEQFTREYPKRFPEHSKVEVEGLNDWVTRSISRTLYLVFGAVALLLAIGCANVSILLLARGTARRHEFAVRTAVGASAGRLTRQLLTESLTLATAGVLVGVAASYGILKGMLTVLPKYAFAPEVAIGLSLPVLLFSAGLAVVTAVLFGLFPAARLSQTQPGEFLAASARRVAGSVRGRRMHQALIAGQIALTLLLLGGAGAAIDGFRRMLRIPLGYDPHGVMSVGIPLRDNAYPTHAARAQYFEQLRARVAETPGVGMTAISSNATPPTNGWYQRFEVLGAPASEERRASVNLVSGEYFPILRIPLAEGRIWTAAETQRAAHVAMINRALAQRYFPNGDAVGRSVKATAFEDRPPARLSAPDSANAWLTIVGIVGDAKNDGLLEPVAPAIYVPYTLHLAQGTQVLVRSQAPPLTLLGAVRAQVAKVDPDQQIYGDSEDLEAWISDAPVWQRQRLAASILGVFGGFALILAAVGLYSVVSYTVAQRTNEFGIRMALGAQRGHVHRIVLTSTASSVCVGIAGGVLASAALSRMMREWAAGSSTSPLILGAGAALVVGIAALASVVPAWQAASVDPAAALRSE